MNDKMKAAFKAAYLKEGKSESEAERLAEIAADVQLRPGLSEKQKAEAWASVHVPALAKKVEPKRHLTAAQAAQRFEQIQREARAGLVDLKEDGTDKLKASWRAKYMREGKSPEEAERLAGLAASISPTTLKDNFRVLYEKAGFAPAEAERMAEIAAEKGATK